MKNKYLALTFVIITLIAGFLAYLNINQKSVQPNFSDKLVTQTNNSQNTSSIPAPEKNNEPKSVKYTNEYFRYSFDYNPSVWEFKEQTRPAGDGYPASKSPTLSLPNRNISTFIGIGDYPLDRECFVETKYAEQPSFKQSKTKAGPDGKMLLNTYTYTTSQEPYIMGHTFLKNTGFCFDIVWQYENTKEDQKLIDEFFRSLETF